MNMLHVLLFNSLPYSIETSSLMKPGLPSPCSHGLLLGWLAGQQTPMILILLSLPTPVLGFQAFFVCLFSLRQGFSM